MSFVRCVWIIRALGMLVAFSALETTASSAKSATWFDIHEGKAAKALRLVALQGGVDVMFATKATQGVITPSIRGEYTPRELLDRLLKDTPLTALQDGVNGAYAIIMRGSDTSPRMINNTPENRIDMKNNPSSISKLFRSILAIGTLTGAAQLAAQDTDEVIELSPFTVESPLDTGYRAANSIGATRLATQIKDIPLKIDVVTEKFIEDIGAINFEDSLDYTAGVVTTNFDNDRNDRQGRPSIRGNIVSFMLRNGFRRNGNLRVNNIERIEVIKGPASIFFGEASPGGFINIITKRAFFGDANMLKFTAGSDGFIKTDIDINRRLSDTVAGRLYASYEHNESWRAFNEKKTPFVAASLRWKPDESFTVNFDFERIETDHQWAQSTPRTFDGWFESWDNDAQDDAERSRWLNSGNWANDIEARTGVRPTQLEFVPSLVPNGGFDGFCCPDNSLQQDSTDITVEATWEANDWFSARAAYNRYDTSYQQLFMWFDVPTPTRKLITELFSARTESDLWNSYQADFAIDWETDTMTNKFIFGYELFDSERERFDPVVDWSRGTQTLANEDVGFSLFGGPRPTLQQNYYANWNPMTMAPPLHSEIVVWSQARRANQLTTGERSGYYFSHQGTYFNDRVHTLVGVRREEFDQVAGVVGTPGGNETSSSGTTPNYGFTFEITDDVIFYASKTENFEPVRGLDVTGPGALPGEGQPFSNISGEGWDAGIKTTLLDNKLSGTIGLYEVKKTGVVTQDVQRTNNDPRNAGLNPSNYVVRFSNQGGNTVVRGIELDLAYTPNDNIQFLFNYTNMFDAKVGDLDEQRSRSGRLADGTVVSLPDWSSDGARLDRTPEHHASFWVLREFNEGPLNGFNVGFGGNYQTKYRLRGGLSPTMTQAEIWGVDYAKFDALISYDFQISDKARTSVALNITNIFDEFYFDGHTVRGAPRQAFLSVKTNF